MHEKNVIFKHNTEIDGASVDPGRVVACVHRDVLKGG